MYVFLNWFFCIITAVWLGYLFFKKRYYFIKPSIILITLSHIFFQLPLAIYSQKYEYAVPDPYMLSFLINGYILIGLLISLYTFQKSSIIIWNRISTLNLGDYEVDGWVIFLFSMIILLIASIYLFYVPFSETGLYAVLNNPTMAAIARERSLKLLDSQTLGYAYSLMTSVLAPLFAVILFFSAAKYFLAKRYTLVFILTLLILLLMFTVSLPGARVYAVNLLLVMTISFLLLKGLPFHPVKLFLLLLLIVIPGVLIGIYREGTALGFNTFFHYSWDFIGRRIFQDPLEVGSWYIHHAQTNGLFGVGAVPKLASIVGYDALNVPNFIGLRYQQGAGSSVSAGAGYLLTYYSYFGPLSIIVSLIGLWLLDMALYVYMALRHSFLIPCVSAVSLSILSLISSDYTTVLITHGFALILIVSIAFNAMGVLGMPGIIQKKVENRV